MHPATPNVTNVRGQYNRCMGTILVGYPPLLLLRDLPNGSQFPSRG